MSIDHDPVESAWRIHLAGVDWTGKVDAKASFVLAAESAAALAVLNLSGSGRRLADLDGWPAVTAYWVGVAALVSALLFVVAVVRPQLRASAMGNEASQNFIFFGHARSWKSDEIESALSSRNLLPQISRQIVAISDIAWRKHIRLKWSINFALAAIVAFSAAAILNDPSR